jgi:hypothetical protein
MDSLEQHGEVLGQRLPGPQVGGAARTGVATKAAATAARKKRPILTNTACDGGCCSCYKAWTREKRVMV